MELLNELKTMGVDIDDGLNRFAGNAALYEKYLKKFPDSVMQREVLPCFEAGDTEAALANAHTLKGMTGNLSLTVLFDAYTKIVALLREGKPQEARQMLESMLPAQAQIIACIKKYM